MTSATERLLRRMWGERWSDALIQDPNRVPTPTDPDAMSWKQEWFRIKDLPDGLDKWLADHDHKDIYITATLLKDVYRRDTDIIVNGAWVLDDVGTKLSKDVVENLLGPPSLAIETSPGNEHWWWFDPAGHTPDEHLTGLGHIKAALGVERLDGTSKTHAYRAPAGTNRKVKYGGNFKVKVVRGTPGVTMTLDELVAKCSSAQAFGELFEGAAGKLKPGLTRGSVVDGDNDGPKGPCASLVNPDPILKRLLDSGLVLHDKGDGRVDIICPNVQEHTGGDPSGTAYVGNKRFWCSHDHCKFFELVHLHDKKTGAPLFEPDGKPKMGLQRDYPKTFDLMRKRMAERVFDDSAGLLGGTPNALGLGKEYFPDGSELSDAQIEVEAEKMDADKRFWKGVLSEWVYVVDHDGFVHTPSGRGPYTDKQFNAMMRGGVEFGHRGVKAASARFLNDRRSKSVAGIDYLPGSGRFVQRDDGQENVNTWTGSGLISWPGAVGDPDVSKWLGVLDHWLPNPSDKTAREMVLDFLAHLVQHPGQKINWMLLVQSETQGVGKDMFFSVMDKILGSANVTQVTSSQLVGGFKAGWIKKQLIFAQELSEAGPRGTIRMDGYNAAKPFLSNPPRYVRVDDKNVKSHMVSNVACFIGFTNKANAMPMEASDRRFVVIESTQDQRLPPSVAKDFVAWLEDAGAHAHGKIKAWLEQRVIGATGSGFVAASCPVLIGDKGELAEAKRAMASAALGTGGRWVQDLLDGRKLACVKEFTLLAAGGMRAGSGGGMTKELIPAGAVNATANEIAAALELAGGVRLRSVQIDMGGALGRVRLWVLDGRVGLYGQMTVAQLRDAYLKELQSVGLGWMAGSATGAKAVSAVF